MKKTRIGVIGTGYLGKFHAEKYAGMENVHLAGVADIKKDRADSVANACDTCAFGAYRDLFGQVDAVSIVVPTPLHFKVARDFLNNGTDVLIEKPITTTLKEADALIALAKEKGRLIQVGHLERFNPAIVASKDLITDPVFIEAHRLSTFKDRCIDVGVVHDLMIHDIDIILNFVKSDINTIQAAGTPVVTGYVDIANARLEFENRCVANVTASRISTHNERKIRFFQRDAFISVDFANHEITRIFPGGQNESGPVPGMETETRRFEKGDALKDELTSFVASVRQRSRPEVTGRMGRDALKIVLSIMGHIHDGYGLYFPGNQEKG